MKNNLTARFSFLQGSFFILFAVGSGFLSLLLQEAGVPTDKIGFQMAILCLACMLTQPVMGYLCDKFQLHRAIYMVCCLCAPVIYLIMFNAKSYALITISVFLMGVFINSLQSMGEGWVASLNHTGANINFGATRGTGSITYAVAVLFLGFAYDKYGKMFFVWYTLATALLVCAACLMLPKPAKLESDSEITTKQAIKALLKNKPYCLFVLCYTLSFIPMASIMTYFPVLFKQWGGSAKWLGLAFFIMTIGELPMMLSYKRLEARFGTEKMFITSLLGHAFKNILIAVSGNIVLACIFGLLQIAGFAISIPCAQSYIEKTVSHRYAATGQLVGAMVGLSFGQIIGNLIAGFLTGIMSVPEMLIITGLFPLLGIVIFVIFNKRVKAEKAKE